MHMHKPSSRTCLPQSSLQRLPCALNSSASHLGPSLSASAAGTHTSDGENVLVQVFVCVSSSDASNTHSKRQDTTMHSHLLRPGKCFNLRGSGLSALRFPDLPVRHECRSAALRKRHDEAERAEEGSNRSGESLPSNQHPSR
jgi:hypothetical protein